MRDVRHNGANGDFREVTPSEGYEILNQQTQRVLGVSAKEFIRGWEAGEYKDRSEDPAVVGLAMLIPIAA
jgi:hypothetical protein